MPVREYLNGDGERRDGGEFGGRWGLSIAIGTPYFISVLIYFSEGGGIGYPVARPYSNANQCSIDGGGCLMYGGVGFPAGDLSTLEE